LALVCDVSRRQFLQYGASSLALASFISGAQSVSPLVGAGNSFRVAPLTQDAAAIAAATDAAQHLRVSVEIDGNGP
jgi:hypothetical protein